MKEIKKEVKRVEYMSVFVANDGTEFSDAAECKKYEESAKGVLMAKYAPMILKSISEEDIFDAGGCDNTFDIVKVSSESDIDLLMQLFFLDSPTMGDERAADYRKVLNRALEEKDFVLIYRGYEEETFCWPRTRAQILESFNKKFEDLNG